MTILPEQVEKIPLKMPKIAKKLEKNTENEPQILKALSMCYLINFIIEIKHFSNRFRFVRSNTLHTSHYHDHF